MMFIQSLPSEVTVNILSFLSLEDLNRSKQVSSDWNEKATFLWNKHFLKEESSSTFIKSKAEFNQKIQAIQSFDATRYQQKILYCRFPGNLDDGQSNQGWISLKYQLVSTMKGKPRPHEKFVYIKEISNVKTPIWGNRIAEPIGKINCKLSISFLDFIFNRDRTFATSYFISPLSMERGKADQTSQKVENYFNKKSREVWTDLVADRGAKLLFCCAVIVVIGSIWKLLVS